MMDKVLRKLSLKDDSGIDDPSLVGFIVIWSIFGYGLYQTVIHIIERFA